MVRCKDKIIFLQTEINDNKKIKKELSSFYEKDIHNDINIKDEEDLTKSPKEYINNNNIKHGRGVPLEVYQKVYDDRKKLKLELEHLNSKIQISNNKVKNNILISSFQSEIKNIQKQKDNLEIAYQNQKENIKDLKITIIKYEKELIIKDNLINELKQKIDELNNKIKNMKEDFKKETKKEILKLNEQINNLQNEMEIKEKKVELNNFKFNNLQLKYLKMIHNKKKTEQNNLLMLSMKQIHNNKINQNNYRTSNSNSSKNNYSDTIKSDTNIVLPVLKDKNISKNIIKNFEKDKLEGNNQKSKNELHNITKNK